MGKLTDVSIKAAKPLGKAYKLTDGDGLYLYVTPTGGISGFLKKPEIPGKQAKYGAGAANDGAGAAKL